MIKIVTVGLGSEQLELPLLAQTGQHSLFWGRDILS